MCVGVVVFVTWLGLESVSARADQYVSFAAQAGGDISVGLTPNAIITGEFGRAGEPANANDVAIASQDEQHGRDLHQ